MNSKLTITLDELIIDKARIFAKSKGYSLSQMVENYFKIITTDVECNELKSSETSIVMSLKGAFKDKKGLNYKKVLSERRVNKYL